MNKILRSFQTKNSRIKGIKSSVSKKRDLKKKHKAKNNNRKEENITCLNLSATSKVIFELG